MNKSKERRVVNIDRSTFEAIKAFCDANDIRITKWLERLAVNEIARQALMAKDIAELYAEHQANANPYAKR